MPYFEIFLKILIPSSWKATPRGTKSNVSLLPSKVLYYNLLLVSPFNSLLSLSILSLYLLFDNPISVFQIEQTRSSVKEFTIQWKNMMMAVRKWTELLWLNKNNDSSGLHSISKKIHNEKENLTKWHFSSMQNMPVLSFSDFGFWAFVCFLYFDFIHHSWLTRLK